MSLLDELKDRWQNNAAPFLTSESGSLNIDQLYYDERVDTVPHGSIVMVEGDFNAASLSTLISLIDKKCIVAPITSETKHQHAYFAEAISANFLITPEHLVPYNCASTQSPTVQQLRTQKHAGLVLFSSGTTGSPKAILHDFEQFLVRFRTPRPALTTLAFLLFDHIGGLNTIFHALFNGGSVVSIENRTVNSVISTIEKFEVDLLPTTPTFLRMLLLSGDLTRLNDSSLKLITYGTERMDQPTLTAISELLPNVDLRQTYGMSELGILRVKSEARDSLFMSVGGEGVETRIIDGLLHIRNRYRMLGYLNAKSPFDSDGWYNTKDMVETKGEYIKITGRTSDQINVGGLKFMPKEVEDLALTFPGSTIKAASLKGVVNPISGQHGELTIEVQDENFDVAELKKFLRSVLPKHMVPLKIHKSEVKISHRFKKSG